MNTYIDSASGQLKQVSTANPLPVQMQDGGAGDASLAEQQAQTALLDAIKTNTANIKIQADSVNLNTDTLESKIGDINEAVPATDTAQSGLNGRLKRLAQHLTALIGLLPAQLGSRSTAGSLSITQSISTPTDLSGSILLGGTAQTLKASDSAGYFYVIQNHSEYDLWYSTVATAVIGKPSMRLAPKDTTPLMFHKVSGALSIIGPVTGQEFSARAWS